MPLTFSAPLGVMFRTFDPEKCVKYITKYPFLFSQAISDEHLVFLQNVIKKAGQTSIGYVCTEPTLKELSSQEREDEALSSGDYVHHPEEDDFTSFRPDVLSTAYKTRLRNIFLTALTWENVDSAAIIKITFPAN